MADDYILKEVTTQVKLYKKVKFLFRCHAWDAVIELCSDYLGRHWKSSDSTEFTNKNLFQREMHLLLARANYYKGEYPNAAKELNLYVMLYPKDVLGYYYLARTHYQLQNHDKTLYYIDNSLALDPNNPKFLLRKALFLSRHNSREALNTIEEVVALNPFYPKAHNANGLLLHEGAEMPEKAPRYYQIALKINPLYHKSYYNIGNVYLDLRQLETAIYWYSKALDIHSTYADCYFNRGTVYRRLKRFAEAANDFLNAARSQPNDEDAWMECCSMLQLLGDVEGVIDVLTEAQYSMRSPSFHIGYSRALAFSNLERYDKALADLEKISPLADCWTWHDLLLQVGYVNQFLGKHDEALDALAGATRALFGCYSVLSYFTGGDADENRV